MEQNFNTRFEDIKHERSLILLLSLVEPYIIGQSKFLDHEIENNKNIQKLHRQSNLKEIIALELLEKQIDDNI